VFHLKMPCIHIYERTQKTPLDINFIYLSSKEINCIFKTCYINGVLFYHKMALILSFFCSQIIPKCLT